VSSTAPTEDMIVPLVPKQAASIVSIDPDIRHLRVWVRYSPSAPPSRARLNPSAQRYALDRALVAPAPVGRDSLK
jgi:hypothetical protein